MKKSTIISLLLVIFWMGLIFFLSNMNSSDSNDSSTNVINQVVNTIDKVTNADNETINNHKTNKYIKDINTLFRKICHALVYLALFILVFNFIIRIMHQRLLIYNIVSIIISLIYAIIDEYHQTFVFGRTGSFTDVLIDSIGILIGVIAISIIYTRIKKKVKYAQ